MIIHDPRYQILRNDGKEYRQNFMHWTNFQLFTGLQILLAHWQTFQLKRAEYNNAVYLNLFGPMGSNYGEQRAIPT